MVINRKYPCCKITARRLDGDEGVYYRDCPTCGKHWRILVKAASLALMEHMGTQGEEVFKCVWFDEGMPVRVGGRR